MSNLLTTSLAFLALFVCGCGASTPTGPNAIDADAPTEFTVTDSGLKYRVLRRAEGPKPSRTDKVAVDYSGWLDNGKIFDSSYKRPEPTVFGVGDVISGWTEGLQLMSVGSMYEFEIPSEMAYGEAGRPGIPPNSDLHFKVELHEIR
jgi:FKBP-type peptidyl-prolyl cis-trans isomerase